MGMWVFFREDTTSFDSYIFVLKQTYWKEYNHRVELLPTVTWHTINRSLRTGRRSNIFFAVMLAITVFSYDLVAHNDSDSFDCIPNPRLCNSLVCWWPRTRLSFGYQEMGSQRFREDLKTKTKTMVKSSWNHLAGSLVVCVLRNMTRTYSLLLWLLFLCFIVLFGVVVVVVVSLHVSFCLGMQGFGL